MNPAAALALVIGAYGAVLTSYSVWQARRQAQPRVLVHLAFAPSSRLAISARNVGRCNVILDHVGLALADGLPLRVRPSSGRMPLPLLLGEGQRYSITVECRAVARALLTEQRFGTVELCGFYVLADAIVVRSEPLPFDVAAWATVAGP